MNANEARQITEAKPNVKSGVVLNKTSLALIEKIKLAIAKQAARGHYGIMRCGPGTAEQAALVMEHFRALGYSITRQSEGCMLEINWKLTQDELNAKVKDEENALKRINDYHARRLQMERESLEIQEFVREIEARGFKVALSTRKD